MELALVGATGLTLVGARGARRLTLVGAMGARVLTLVGATGAIGLTFVGAMGVAVAAHHSVLPFDGSTATTIEGSVARVLWQNPHTLIAVDVGGERWTIESESSTVLARLGWTRDVVSAGDKVIVTGARAKDGRRLMRCTTITVNAHRLPCFGSRS